MSANIQKQTPTPLQAGDTLRWEIALDDYPASDGWVLHYVLNTSNHTLHLTSAAEGDAHVFNTSAADSATWQSGYYNTTAYVTNGAERFTLGKAFPIVITADLAAASDGYDARTPAEKCLAAIDEALATRGAKLAYTQEYSIGDRRMKFTTPTELMNFRAQLQREVAQEKQLAAQGGHLGLGKKIRVRF